MSNANLCVVAELSGCKGWCKRDARSGTEGEQCKSNVLSSEDQGSTGQSIGQHRESLLLTVSHNRKS